MKYEKFSDDKTPIVRLKELIVKFRNERKWKKYHTPKDLAISISIEANELLELFQWLSKREVAEKCRDKKFLKRIQEELADVVIYCLNLSDILNIDLAKAIKNKIKKNEKKYPVDKFKGRYFKY